MEEISSVHYSDIYQQKITSLFSSAITDASDFVSDYSGNYQWNSNNNKK
jgi:hypothetical protein